MKKQLLIAAVAATMTSAAMADISLTGDVTASINHKAGASTVKWNEVNLAVTGTNGANKAVVTMTSTAAGAFTLEESYVSTSIEGLSVKIGTMNGRTGTSMTHADKASSKVSVGTSIGGVKVGYSIGNGSKDGKTTVSGSIAGFSVKMQDALEALGDRYTTVTGDVAGVAVTAEISKGADAFSVSKEIAGVNFMYADLDKGSNNNADQDSTFGNIDGHTNISGIVASTSTTLGKVIVKDYSSTTSAGVATDTTKITLKRGGFSYTMSDTDGVNSIEAKVRFKF
jgi:hypothetical protein